MEWSGEELKKNSRISEFKSSCELTENLFFFSPSLFVRKKDEKELNECCISSRSHTERVENFPSRHLWLHVWENDPFFKYQFRINFCWYFSPTLVFCVSLLVAPLTILSRTKSLLTCQQFYANFIYVKKEDMKHFLFILSGFIWKGEGFNHAVIVVRSEMSNLIPTYVICCVEENPLMNKKEKVFCFFGVFRWRKM